MSRPSARQTQHGFSLIELVVALAVAAILLGMAAPSFRDMIRRGAGESAVYDLLGDLQFARSEAIRRGARVTVCAAGADDACGASWNRGRIVFVDDATADAGGAAGAIDAGETVLRRSGAVRASLSVDGLARTATNAAAAGAVGFVRFGPRGTSNWRGSGHFAVRPEPCEPAQVNGLVVSLSGDVRRARRGADGSAIGAFGTAIGCPATAAS